MPNKPSEPTMARLLAALSGRDGMTTADLRDSANMHSSSVYQGLRKLAAIGHVSKHQQGMNVHAVYAITADGRRWLEEAKSPGQKERRLVDAARLLAKCLGYPS